MTRVSSLEKTGISELWEMQQDFKQATFSAGELTLRREKQLKLWLWNHIKDHIMGKFENHSSVKNLLPQMEDLVVNGHVTPGLAADYMMKQFIMQDGLENNS